MEILVQLIIDLFSALGGKSATAPVRPPPLPGNSQRQIPRPGNPRAGNPRPAPGQPMRMQNPPIRRQAVKRPPLRPIAGAARAPQPPPLPQPQVAKVVAAPPRSPITATRPNSTALSGEAIRRLVLTRPGALKSMYVFSEILRPPLALRQSANDLL